MKRLWIAVIILALFIAFGLIGYLSYQRALIVQPTVTAEPPTVPVDRGPVDLTITAPGKLVNTNSPTLYMNTSGVIAEVPVREGDPVREGETLIVLVNSAQLDADLALETADAQQRIFDAQEELEKAQSQRAAMDYPRAVDPLIVEQAQVSYEMARREYEKSLNAFEKVKHKPTLNPARVQALDALVAAEQVMNNALVRYNWYNGTYTESQILQAQAAVAVAQATLQQAQSELDELQARRSGQTLTAPFAGVVLDVMVEPGQAVDSGEAAIALIDPQALEAWTMVIEEDIPLVEIGQLAELYIDALPDTVVTGTISHIIPQSISGEDRPLFHVIVQLHETPANLLDGMNLDAAIIVARHEDVLRLPRSVIRPAADDASMVLVWVNGQEVERPVEIGLRGDQYVEILSGLSEGERAIAR